MSNDTLEIERVAPRHAQAVRDLFMRADVPCFCQYYQFQGDHRDWQNRCANATEENAAALCAEIEAESVMAWVAVYSQQVVGWVRLRRPGEMSKLYEGRLYRGLPCFSGDRERVATVSCFLVQPEWRRQGLASELLGTALDGAKTAGFSAIEALPRGATDVTDEEHWMGPATLYEQAGFVKIHDFAPYPVFRLELGSGAD